MVRALLVRMAGAVGLLALSFLLVGLIPFLGTGPSSGAGYLAKAPASAVNHQFKGDRLPLFSSSNSVLTKNVSRRLQNSKEVPDGCDRSFSPISAPQLAYVYGRCTT